MCVKRSTNNQKKTKEVFIMLNKSGSLSVRAYTAGGAIPIKGAVVRIFGAEDENREVVYSLLTDEDGITEHISLPTPPRGLSEIPDSTVPPFAIYNVEVEKDGYFSKRLYNLPVFEGVNSEQPIAMIPLSYDLPRGNLSADTDLTDQGGLYGV
jgi:hypothetical protein